jgi:hypothetical protein
MNQPQQTPAADSSTQVEITPLRCVTGSIISGGFASAVRTLVVGIVALGAGIFGLVALGLFALSIQLLIQKLTTSKSN